MHIVIPDDLFGGLIPYVVARTDVLTAPGPIFPKAATTIRLII